MVNRYHLRLADDAREQLEHLALRSTTSARILLKAAGYANDEQIVDHWERAELPASTFGAGLPPAGWTGPSRTWQTLAAVASLRSSVVPL